MPVGAYLLRGVARIYIVPSVAVKTAPTRAEINAGVNLTAALQGVTGFAVESQLVDIKPVGASFVEQRPGANKVTGPCALTLYEQKTVTTVRTAVAVGTVACIIIAPYGDVVSRRCEVWPVRVASLANTWAPDGGAVFRAVFAPTTAPTQNGVLPA